MNKTDAILINSLKPMYELYHGELSKRHPINLYHEGTDIVIDEYESDGVGIEIARIDYTTVSTDIDVSSLMALSDVYSRPCASLSIMRDIIGYIKSKRAFDNYQDFLKTLVK